MTAERAVMLVKKVTHFGEFGYLNSLNMYQKKYYFNVFECLEGFPAAMLVPIWMGTSMASLYKSL